MRGKTSKTAPKRRSRAGTVKGEAGPEGGITWFPRPDSKNRSHQTRTRVIEGYLEESGAVAGKTIVLVDVDQVEPDHLVDLVTMPGTAGICAGVRGVILLLTRSASLSAWTDVSPRHGTLKRNEWFIHLLSAYEIARLIPDLPAEGDSSSAWLRFERHIKRFALKPDAWDHDLASGLHGVAEDLTRLHNVAHAELANLAPVLATSARPFDFEAFMKSLGVLYQLGRRPHLEAEARVREELLWLRPFGGSFELRQQLESLFARRPARARDRMRFAALQSKLWAYELLRDFALWAASGAAYWADRWKRQNDSRGRPGPLRVLIIDEALAKETDESGRLRDRLSSIHRAFRPGTLAFEHLTGDVLEQVSNAIAGRGFQRALLSSQNGALESLMLFEYDFVLVEVEFSRRRVGPALVQQIATYFERQEDEDRHRDPPPTTPPKGRPGLIVLTRARNHVHVQQSLNHGADAYVLKDRIYQLPARATRTRLPRGTVEPRGRKANFRSLYQLVPREIAKLQSEDADRLVLGNEWDLVEREWIRSLPKADLHCHIGTSIRLNAVEALAFNTCGYLAPETADGAPPDLLTATQHICEIVLLARELKGALADHLPAARLLLFAAALVMERDAPGERRPARVFHGDAPYETLIGWLARAHARFEAFELSSLLAAALFRAASPDGSLAVDTWRYVADLGQWFELHAGGLQPWVESLRRVVGDQCRALTSRGWRREYTRREVEETFLSNGADDRTFWANCHARITSRVERALALIDEGLIDAAAHLRSSAASFDDRDLKQRVLDLSAGTPSIRDVIERNYRVIWGAVKRLRWPSKTGVATMPFEGWVRIPGNPQANEQTLLRYLWGAGLMGAEHLQYPENLLLAAKDVVEQAVEDNVAYTEMRCATTGYCVGGMSPVGATELLCSALDLAATHFFLRGRRCVRTNVLLGAKRHKARHEFEDTVWLLTHFLQRAQPASPRPGAPVWWRPSAVVGFDLSGNEAASTDEFEALMEPLRKLCAPITIHAGEAASAQSIWRAVYRFAARRIGHGVRLREDARLLNYCISEGLCMEMCPISNKFTNGFKDVPSRKAYSGQSRDRYPLRYYLERGLDVCINTDNRQLHEASTLTDDYMAAARMVGGLTRWEVLRIVKAGFKHAFLPKDEVELILRAVEDEVYRRVAAQEFSFDRVAGS